MKKHLVYTCKGIDKLKDIINENEKDGYDVCGLSERGFQEYTVVLRKSKFEMDLDNDYPYVIRDYKTIPVYTPEEPIPTKIPKWEVTCTNNNFTC